MKQLTCEMCGGTDLIKQDGVFVCQNCGMKYSVEEAKKMMIEGTVDVQGTVKVDNSAFVERYLQNAHRALMKEDWEEVEKYYNMVEQNAPNNIEAVFFSSYGKAMLSMTDSDYFKRQQKFEVLNRSMSVISDYYDTTSENKEDALKKIAKYILKMYEVTFVYDRQNIDIIGAVRTLGAATGTKQWCIDLIDLTRTTFINELKQILEKHEDSFVKEILSELESYVSPQTATREFAQGFSEGWSETTSKIKGGCYVATAVYGSYDCPHVWTLRRYRDYTLAETWHGRAFIKIYYAISPTLVKWFGHTEWFKNMWKGKLDRMVAKLQADGVESTPYEDKEW